MQQTSSLFMATITAMDRKTYNRFLLHQATQVRYTMVQSAALSPSQREEPKMWLCCT